MHKKKKMVGTDPEVIHVIGTTKTDSCVSKDKLSVFLKKPAVLFIYSTIFKSRTAETIMQEAENSLGELKNEYNVFSKNCQHFATRCQAGKGRMTDINKLSISNVKTFFTTLANSFKHDNPEPFENFDIVDGALLHHPEIETYWGFNFIKIREIFGS